MHISTDLRLFFLAALVLAVSPGPSVLYIVTRSISQGRLAGIVSCAGVACGGIVHVIAATLGLSALLATSAVAFQVIKYAGAAYLVWLGVMKLITSPARLETERTVAHSLNRVFRDGVMVNILNPKTALFFLAFLPQFVAPFRGPVTLQFILLGLAFVTIAFCTDSVWSLIASTTRDRLWRHPKAVSAERYIAGSIYIGLGLSAALAGNGRK